MTTVTFDEPFDPDEDPYAVILSPANPDRAYDYTVADVLLDLHNDLVTERDRLNKDDDARIGILRALYMLDYRLSMVTGNRISLDSLPPID